MTHSSIARTSQVSIHSGCSAENDSANAAAETITYKGKTLTKTKSIKSKIAGFVRKLTRAIKRVRTALRMQIQHVKNLSVPVQPRENPLYNQLPKAPPAALAMGPGPAPVTIHRAAATSEIFTPPETVIAETASIETIPSQIVVDQAPPAFPGKWQIEDIDLERATLPTSHAVQLPTAKATLVTLKMDESTQAAAPYVKAELNAPAFKEFQTQDAKARDLLRLKHDDLFPLSVEQLDTIYDTAYVKVFAEQYAAARKAGRAEAAALKFAGAMAAESVLIDFLASVDPAHNGYAKVMEKFEQNVVDTTSALSGKQFTSISYELRAKSASKENVGATAIENHIRDEAIAREVMRADNGDTFIAAGISPDGLTMRKLNLAYDATYKLAFKKQFTESIRQGQTASQALAGAKAIATTNASLTFTFSRDPLRIAYAKVMKELEADENMDVKAPEINWAAHPDANKSSTAADANN